MKNNQRYNQRRNAAPQKVELTPAQRAMNAATFPLSRLNLWLMVASVVVIVLGFVLMLGPGTTEAEFNPDIFSTRRIVVGPLIAFLGFVAMAFAIIYNNRKDDATAADDRTAVDA